MKSLLRNTTKDLLMALVATSAISSTAWASDEQTSETSEPAFKLFGRVQLDGWQNESSADTDFGDRRLRLGLLTRFSDAADFVVDLDFANSEVVPQDVRLAYRFAPSVRVQIGHIKLPSSLDERTDDLFSAFIERAAFSQLSPAYALGGLVTFEGADWAVDVGAFQRTANGDNSYDFGGDGHQLAVRGGRVIDVNDTDWIYLGAAAHRAENGSDPFWTSSVASENGGSQSITLVLPDPDREDFIGLEFVSHFSGIVVQAEIGDQQFETLSGRGASVSGGYIEVSWLPGATRSFNISNGTMGAFAADAADFTLTGGQFQIGLRLTTLDVDDDVAGTAELSSVTAGLNYHMGSNVRVMVNYIDTDITNFGQIAQDDQSWGVRLQKYW